MPEDEKKNASISFLPSGWWSTYFVRYFLGSIVGIICIIILSQSPMFLSYSEMIKSIFPTSEFLKAPILAISGLAFCYFSSAPILVLHPYRTIHKFLDKKFPLENLIPDSFVFLFIISFIIPWMTGCIYFLLFPCVILIVLNSCFRVELKRFYESLKISERNEAKDFRDSYTHLREHGNAFFIVIMEIIFTITLFQCKSINDVVFLAFFWILPAAMVWASANHIETILITEKIESKETENGNNSDDGKAQPPPMSMNQISPVADNPKTSSVNEVKEDKILEDSPKQENVPNSQIGNDAKSFNKEDVLLFIMDKINIAIGATYFSSLYFITKFSFDYTEKKPVNLGDTLIHNAIETICCMPQILFLILLLTFLTLILFIKNTINIKWIVLMPILIIPLSGLTLLIFTEEKPSFINWVIASTSMITPILCIIFIVNNGISKTRNLIICSTFTMLLSMVQLGSLVRGEAYSKNKECKIINREIVIKVIGDRSLCHRFLVEKESALGIEISEISNNTNGDGKKFFIPNSSIGSSGYEFRMIKRRDLYKEFKNETP